VESVCKSLLHFISFAIFGRKSLCPLGSIQISSSRKFHQVYDSQNLGADMSPLKTVGTKITISPTIKQFNQI